MMKKLTALLVVLIMCFTLCACSAEKAEDGTTVSNTTSSDVSVQETTEPLTTEALTTELTTTEEPTTEEVTIPSVPADDNASEEAYGITPLLYKVTDANGNVIWLFGSIHIGKEEFYPLPDYVMDAFNSSDALAVEADVSSITGSAVGLAQSMKSLIYIDGTTIKDHISEETYTAAVAALTDLGLYSGLMDYYCPSMWWSLIESGMILQTGVDATLGVDMHLLSLADESRKEVREIESVAFQYEMLGEFSDELQEALLESAIEYADEAELYEQSLNLLMALWATGDEEAFASYLSASDEDPGMSAELYEEYNTAMIINRNKNMTDYAVDALASGEEVFICVGAAHVVGDGAIADNLRELGYTVEVVR
ncbi:MAG: TraB/GumN family protein [Clostridia bacterium]|nr:TraB/GumN family protein [Clostridia bacterium]